MSALHKATAFFLFAFFLLMSPAFLQAQAPDVPLEKVLEKIQTIDERTKRIEANQKEILEREEKILAEIGNLRVWVRQS